MRIGPSIVISVRVTSLRTWSGGSGEVSDVGGEISTHINDNTEGASRKRRAEINNELLAIITNNKRLIVQNSADSKAVSNDAKSSRFASPRPKKNKKQ